jgi:hypothetical protein
MGLELTIAVFELAKTFHALNHGPTVAGEVQLFMKTYAGVDV